MTDLQEQRFEKHLRSTGSDVEIKDADDGAARIRIPVSSTAQDRDGDQFSRRGLEDMREQLESGKVPMMLDHGRGSEGGFYGTLGIVGRWDGGEIVTEKADGESVDVLIGEGTLNPANPDAEQLRDYLDADMPVGASVGFRVLDYEHDRDEDVYTFNEVDLLETSLVGIPSNPLTVNDGASGVGALAKAYTTGTLDGQTFARALSSIRERAAPSDSGTTGLLDALDHGDEAPGDTQTDSAATPGDTMADEDTNPEPDATSGTDNDLLERVVSIQERTIEQQEAQSERLDALEQRFDDLEETLEASVDEDEAPEKDATGAEEGDEPDDPRSLKVVLEEDDDVDEKALQEFERLKEHATDDGEIDLAESETRLFADDEEAETDDNETTREKGGLI